MSEDNISLLDSIVRNDADTVQFLIFSQLICPNFVINGESPIVVAAKNGREEILDILIQSGCDLTTPDFTDITWRKRPIHIAAAKGYTGFVKKLIDQGISVESVDLEMKTPLHWASLFGHVGVVECLLSAGADVNTTQIDGFTPLHCSSALDHVDVCKLLLDNGAKPNMLDEDGWTSVHHAAAYGHYSVIQTLHKSGACLNIKTPSGDNVLHIAACTWHDNQVKLLQYLVENRVPLNDKNGCGYTALHIACLYNIYDNVKCLVELGAIMNTSDDYGDSPLFSASCAYNSHDIITFLIKSGYNCSKELWIHEDRFPLALVNNLPLVSTLKLCASNARTLQELCRFCVLKHLGIHCSDKINSLPIPTSLKSYLKTLPQ